MRRPRYLVICFVVAVTKVAGVPALAAPGANLADQFTIVNCLLPGQIRQLGNKTTYISSRRPMKVTAQECRIRGGEYVLKDEATLSSALKVWLRSASEGDVEAQVTLGEIFEQGLGLPPDYQAAKLWYEKAAAQGSVRAMVNLGNLFERGLGTSIDPARALALYRQAAGLPTNLSSQQRAALDPISDVAPVDALLQQEIVRLEATLASMRSETESLRAALQERQEPSRAQTDESVAAIERSHVLAYETELAARDQRIAELTSSIETLRSRDLNAAQFEKELEQLRATTAHHKAQLAAKAIALETAEQHETELLSSLAELERELEAKDAQAQRHLTEMERLFTEVSRLRRQTQRARAPSAAGVAVHAPAITLVDPTLPTTRGLVKVTVPVQLEPGVTRRIIGQVSAPAGLLSLSVNGTTVATNAAGVFSHDVKVAVSDTDIAITAVDQHGQRSDLAFVLARDVAVPFKPPQIKLGNYHALLIGNTDYQYLPRLQTPKNDVVRLKALLQKRYGFRVRVLMDATRYETLSALNELRENLTSNDNLLIYYAGHGELDRTNLRGHWLPVDAERTNTANWLSNIAVTDILNVIKAKQIMLVADSCYSGTLTRSALTSIDTARTEAEQATWLELMSLKKARVVLTSGGLAPVLDIGGGRHSVFADAFLNTLEHNADLMTGRSLYQAVAARVAHAAAAYEFEQVPAYAPISRSGHEAGDFLLLPRSR